MSKDREAIADVIGAVFDAGTFDGAHRDHHLQAADAVLALLGKCEAECPDLRLFSGQPPRCQLDKGHEGYHVDGGFSWS